jgi:hypothetical protein
LSRELEYRLRFLNAVQQSCGMGADVCSGGELGIVWALNGARSGNYDDPPTGVSIAQCSSSSKHGLAARGTNNETVPDEKLSMA